MKRRLPALLLTAALALGLAACTPSATETSTPPSGASAAPSSPGAAPAENSKTPSGEPITIKFWGGVQGEYGYDALVEAFNEEFASQGIQLEYTRYVNDSDGNLQLDTYLAAGNDIDIFMCYGGTTRFNNRVDAGLCLDLTNYLTTRGFDPDAELGANNVAPYVRDGSYYGLPTKTDNKSWMVVNADMFEAAGIPLPLDGWTYAEFYDACRKLTSGEGMDKVYGMMWNFSLVGDHYLSGVSSPLNPNMIYKDGASETNFDDPVWHQGVQLTLDTIENGYAYGWDDEVGDSLSFANVFLEGKAAMALGVNNIRIIRDLETYPHDFSTALVPFPVPDESYMDVAMHPADSSAGDLICINSKTKCPEECVDFIIWYIQGGMAPLASGGRIPLWSGFDKGSVVSVLNEGAEGAFVPESVEAYLSVGDGIAREVLTTEFDAQINTIFTEELQAILYGQKSVDDGLKDMKARSDALLK